PAGSHLFRFSRRSLRLALQSTARSNDILETYVHHNKKRTTDISGSFFTSAKILLYQPRLYFI
ncbi:hypothetical protein P4575_23905, partial [Priestia megaterium]|uniref:hypothetical protein n=1 Tax=Priestia megaterium TaxID=1404 RepID=UPI002E24F158|nr:hypothetical protein [Priestia megaterium]